MTKLIPGQLSKQIRLKKKRDLRVRQGTHSWELEERAPRQLSARPVTEPESEASHPNSPSASTVNLRTPPLSPRRAAQQVGGSTKMRSGGRTWTRAAKCRPWLDVRRRYLSKTPIRTLSLCHSKRVRGHWFPATPRSQVRRVVTEARSFRVVANLLN